MFNQNDIYVMNQSKALTAIGESLKTIGSQLQSLAPPGNTLDPPDSQNTAAVDKPEEDAVSCDQILENCTDSLHAPLSTEGEETMAKVKVRLRVCVGYNRDHSPIIKQISADSETELADRVAIALMQSERRNEFIKYADDPIRSSVPLFRDYAEEWFTVYKASRIKATTAGGYRTILQSHLYPAWGGTPLYSLPMALLGLTIIKPGMKEIRLAPSLMGLSKARVELLTPSGKVICEMEEGEKPQIQCPEDVRLIIEEIKEN